MDDIQIKNLFAEFNPVPGSTDDNFIERVQHNIDSVRIVKNRIRQIQSAYRRAALLASLAGFVSGLIFSIILTHFIPTIKHLNFSFVPEMSIILAGWVVVALLAIFFTIFSYHISISYLNNSNN